MQGAGPQSFNLGAAIAAQIPAGHTVTAIAPTKSLAGVSANVGAVTIDYDGTSPVGSITDVDYIVTTQQNSAEQDWQTRIGGSEVVWYHPFLNAAEVNNFRWANLGLKPVDWSGSWGGNDPTGLSIGADGVRHRLDDGVGYGGCLELYRAAGTLDGADWWRPFSPLTGAGNGRGQDDPGADGTIAARAFSPTPGGSQTAQFGAHGFYGHTSYHSTYPGGFDGTEYYLQVRVKMDPNRADASAPANSFGKLFYFTRTDLSNTSQEINTESGQLAGSPRQNYFSMYRSGSPPLEDDTPGLGNQPGSEYGTFGDGVCRFDDFGGRRVNCWAWPPGEWVTVLYYVKPGLNSGNDTIVRVWVKQQGWQNPVKIWDQTTVDLPYGAGNPFGHNALICSRYMNGGNFAVGFYHRYAQIIFSRAPIPWPQV